jgi:hypothetical protein
MRHTHTQYMRRSLSSGSCGVATKLNLIQEPELRQRLIYMRHTHTQHMRRSLSSGSCGVATKLNLIYELRQRLIYERRSLRSGRGAYTMYMPALSGRGAYITYMPAERRHIGAKAPAEAHI